MNLALRISAILFLIGAQGGAVAQSCITTSNVIETLKRCIPGIEVRSTTSPVSGDTKRRYFEISVAQPIDEDHPKQGTFRQRLLLAHRGFEEPMVLVTTGYSLAKMAPGSLTTFFDTNEIQIEHRYFGKSTPANKDWSKLNIRQTAGDFHRIVEAFKKIYGKAWINTGVSKGGMTSIYHRRFYPSDVEGTVAYCAPLSFTTSDPRYITFLDQVGGEEYQECRIKLSELQIHLLKNRERFEAKLSGEFEYLGGKDVAFEHAIQEMPFYYWQNYRPDDPAFGCDKIPGPVSLDDEVVAFINRINSLDGYYGDKRIQASASYFYQLVTELGAPALKRSHLLGLLKYPFAYEQYAPKGVAHHFSEATMRDIASWVDSHGERFIFTYGEFDPWTAGKFPKCRADCHRYIVRQGQHCSSLRSPEKEAALAIVSHWLQKSFDFPRGEAQDLESLEGVEGQNDRVEP